MVAPVTPNVGPVGLIQVSHAGPPRPDIGPAVPRKKSPLVVVVRAPTIQAGPGPAPKREAFPREPRRGPEGVGA